MIKNRQTSVLIPACSPQIIECDHPSGCICNHCKKHHVEQPESFDTAQDKSGQLACEKHNRILIGKERCVDCDKEHKIGEHGAVGYVTQEGRVCVECSRPIEDKEERIDWKIKFAEQFYNTTNHEILDGIPYINVPWIELKTFISQVREEAYKEGQKDLIKMGLKETEKKIKEYFLKEGGE